MVKKYFLMPIITLSIICFVVSGSLAFVNTLTQPVIQHAAEQRAEAAMREIIKEADHFIEIKDIEDLPRTITAVFSAENNANELLGHIFMISAPGYGGNINMLCGVDNKGRIIRIVVLSHTETKGMTDAVFAEAHQSQYNGKDKNLNSIIPVTGATVSSNAIKNGVQDALTVYQRINHE